MNNLQKFAAQRLTKQQMNDIRGGGLYECKFKTSNNVEYTQYVIADDLLMAVAKVEFNGDVEVHDVSCVLSLLDGPVN